jgi:hypothetical protein
MKIELGQKDKKDQQKELISNIMARTIEGSRILTVFSMNNGDIQTPIDGIYKSDRDCMDLINLSLDSRQSKKLSKYLRNREKTKALGIYLKNIDIYSLEEGLQTIKEQRDDREQLIVITNILKKLKPHEKGEFLETLHESMQEDDICILSFETSNTEEDELMESVYNANFNIEEAISTQDATSTSLVLSKSL